MGLAWLLAGALQGGGAAPGPDPIPARVAAVSAAELEATVEELVAFHNRNTLSAPDADDRGIGAARRYLEGRFAEIAEASGGRLQVRRQEFTVRGGPRGAERDVEVVNVYGYLPGTQEDERGRTYVVSGHYDSINSDRWDTEDAAPGADDDASGTAVVLEVARVLADLDCPANLVFLCVAGEEQGLWGSKHFAAEAEAAGVAIDGMITNDIVGGVEGGNGVRDADTIRCFSDADGLHSPSRELARTVAEAAARYAPEAAVKLVFRKDRFGRGGDHEPFHDLGMPAVRLTEANEHYARQHQDVRTEAGIAYGDLPEHVSADYMAKVARVNAAALAQLALAPAPPRNVRLRAALRYDTSVSWEPGPGSDGQGYVVVWRDTTAPVWERRSTLTTDTSLLIPGITADNAFFGVRAVNAWGHESRTAYPDRP